MKEKLKKEIIRCKELLKLYEEIPTGFFGASVIKMAIKNAEFLLLDGNFDTATAKKCLDDLKEMQG